MNLTIGIIIMLALIVFTMRYAFFIEKFPIKLTDKMKSFLSFTAPCILTAMAAPIVFGDLTFSMNAVHNPYLLAGLATIVISLVVKKTLLVVLLGMFLFTLLNYLQG